MRLCYQNAQAYPNTPPAVLVRAIDLALGHSLKWSEVYELRARLDAIEATATDDPLADRVRRAPTPIEVA